MLALGPLLDELAGVYGELEPPPVRSAFELLLLENVAYLVDDRRRATAFDMLTRSVGATPEAILSATPEELERVTTAGILQEHQANKLRAVAELAARLPLNELNELPVREAKRVLMRFPSIGEPGAEKILLFSRSHALPGLDSNAVRVLTRVGIAQEMPTYAATYRDVQRVLEPYLVNGVDWLIRAHLLVRRHGQELCKRSRPRCERCPLTRVCEFYAGTAAAGGPSADQVSPR